MSEIEEREKRKIENMKFNDPNCPSKENCFSYVGVKCTGLDKCQLIGDSEMSHEEAPILEAHWSGLFRCKCPHCEKQIDLTEIINMVKKYLKEEAP